MLRRGGAPPAAARAELALGVEEGEALEALLAARALGGGEQTPRFARHAAHVRAVMAEGGFPSFAETRGGDGRPVLTPRLTWPRAAPEGSRRRG